MVLLGQSGTGKSFLIKEISKQLKKEGKNVSVTASTGIASLNVNGQTIHSWSGIKDGRFSDQELEDKLNKNEHYIQYKQNILSTDCLIIDEISMISKKIFEQIERRKTEKKGLRVIGFKRSSVLKHEDSLYQFYDTSNNNDFDNSGNLTCCKVVFNNTEGISVETNENSDLDDEEIEEIDYLLSKDTDITDEPCEPDQELFVDLKEIAALFFRLECNTNR
ncbi:PIF1 [Mytilus edulis]|uniref:ATP-dependent DNA helicase n=1 Tax=Mytilus edulis TaxID=6550 RepID=A0A8S3SVR5_MYTED|nr:PIF1 [Mytilus edulis]